MAANRPLLVPVDGSAASFRALRHALARCRTDPSLRTVVLHVQTPMPPSYFVTPRMIREHQAAESAATFRRARAIAGKRRSEVEYAVARGPAGATIAGYAKAVRAVGVIMGTRGLGGLRSVLLGSTAMKVVHLAAIPVTLVK